MLSFLKENCSLKVLILFAVVVINCYFLAFRFDITTNVSVFNSDAATTSLYSEEISKTGKLFPPDWAYNNGDVWLYDHTLIVVPLLEILPNGPALYLISSTVIALVILLGFALGLRALGLNSNAVLASVAVLASGITSPFIAELLYNWGGWYGAQFLLAFLQMVIIVRIANIPTKSISLQSLPKGDIGLLCLIVFISSTSNSSRAVMYHFLPYIFCLSLLWVQQRKLILKANICTQSEQNINTAYLTIITLFTLSFFAGAYGNNAILGSVTGLTNPVIYSASSLIEHLSMIVKSWLYLTGYPIGIESTDKISGVGVTLKSPIGLYYSIRIVLSFALVIFPILFIRRALLTYALKRSLSAIIMVPTVSFGLASFFHLTSFRYPNDADYTSIRYLFVPFLLILTASVVVFRDKIEHLLSNIRNVCFFSIVILFIAYMNHVYPSTKSVQSEDFKLVSCLQSQGLEYGYGGFWTSNVLTVLSNSKLKVRPVSIFNQQIDRFPMHSTANWYDSTEWQGQSFLLLSEAENSLINKDWLTSILGEVDSEVNCGRFNILVFKYDIAKRLIGPFDEFVMNINTSTSHNIGVFDTARDEMVAGKGEVGFIMYGPYLPLKKNKYKASVNVYFPKGVDDNLVGGFVDIVANRGGTILAKLILKADPSWQELVLPFEVNIEVDDLELRVYSNGNAPIKVRGKVEIYQVK